MRRGKKRLCEAYSKNWKERFVRPIISQLRGETGLGLCPSPRTPHGENNGWIKIKIPLSFKANQAWESNWYEKTLSLLSPFVFFKRCEQKRMGHLFSDDGDVIYIYRGLRLFNASFISLANVLIIGLLIHCPFSTRIHEASSHNSVRVIFQGIHSSSSSSSRSLSRGNWESIRCWKGFFRPPARLQHRRRQRPQDS